MSAESSKQWLTRHRSSLALSIAAAAVAAWGCTTSVPTSEVNPEVSQSVSAGRTGAAVSPRAGAGAGQQQTLSPADIPGLAPQASKDVKTPVAPPVQEGAPAAAAPAPEAPSIVEAIPGSPWKDVPVSDKPFNPAVPLTSPVDWPRTQNFVSPEVAESEQWKQGGPGVVMGRIVDRRGNIAAGVPVMTELEQTTTNEDGWYRLAIKPGPASYIRIGGNAEGYIPKDWNLNVFPEESLLFHQEVLRLDQTVTRINLAAGGVANGSPIPDVPGVGGALQSNGLLGSFKLFQSEKDLYAVYMEVPPGALEFPDGRTETDVRLTWLDPLPRPGAPFGDLYGPLQSYTVWDNTTNSGILQDKIEPFDPVNFADLDLGGAVIKPGAEVKVKWVVGKEVERQFPIKLENGQAFFPCYQYDNGWTKPVLATVFFERGYFWATYTMRGSNSPTVEP